MIRYVSLENFLSHGKIKFNFEKSQKETKKFAAIYGENGSGKTNFIKAMRFLTESERSFANLDKIQELQQALDSIEDNKSIDLFKSIREHVLLSDFKTLLSQYRMINCDKPTRVEYGFNANGHNGKYVIVFDSSIKEESLYFFTGKQSGNFFVIKRNEQGIDYHFSTNLFSNSSVAKDYKPLLDKFWGNHTFLSIIKKQISEQNKLFIQKNYNNYFIEAIDSLFNLCIYIKGNSIIESIMTSASNSIRQESISGRINVNELPDLIRTEHVLNDILTQSYADIKKVKYEIKQNELFVYKMISGNIRKISFENESSGTCQLLRILPSMLAALNGSTVFIDEADTSIHDILFKKVLNAIRDQITGQLIITTHNTMLLESIPASEVYVISVDYLGNKKAICIDEYGIKKNNNARNMYLHGLFGGVPTLDEIEPSSIIDDLNADYSNNSKNLVDNEEDTDNG